MLGCLIHSGAVKTLALNSLPDLLWKQILSPDGFSCGKTTQLPGFSRNCGTGGCECECQLLIIQQSQGTSFLLNTGFPIFIPTWSSAVKTIFILALGSSKFSPARYFLMSERELERISGTGVGDPASLRGKEPL